MKTDVKNLNKTTGMIVVFFLVSVIGAMVAFMLFDNLAVQVVVSISTLVAVAFYITFKMYYREHRKIMLELEDKNPVDVVLWLVVAKDEDQSALIDFLDEESLLSIKVALETYMDVNHKIDLMPLYRKVYEAL